MAFLRCTKKVVVISVAAALVVVAVVLLLVFLLPNKSDSPGSPRVTVEQGELEGEWLDYETGDDFKQFASFRGIPFAQPPLGDLRFKAPRPPAKWEGIKEVKSEKDICLQLNDDSKIEGSEDCLYLSVFTPQLPENGRPLRPVLVYIHGGVWLGDSNRISRYGPHFLVHEDIVVATLNYRLHAFGFLSLDTEEIPGNAAIKDMVAGFDWVYKNIDKFGGDPKQITLAGQSVGSGSAHWLAQLPVLEGKIQRAIIMSGSAYHSWAFTEKNLDIAQQLGQKLKNTTSTLSLSALTDLFKNSPTEEFGPAAAEFGSAKTQESQPDLPFAPTREVRPVVPNGEPRLITRDAESYFINREVPPIPTIMGITNREWTIVLNSMLARYNDTELSEKLEDLSFLIPKNILPWKDTRDALNITTTFDAVDANSDIMKKVHDEYFSSTNTSCNLRCKTLLYGDHVMMQMDTNRWAQYRAQRFPDVPVYLYRFSVTSQYNPISTPGFTAPLASHGSDLMHLFHSSELKQDYSGKSIGSITVRRLSRLFANFVKYGKPVPQTDDLLNVDWTPNQSTESRVTLLNIGSDLTLVQEQLPGEHVDFWNNLYAEYRKNDRTTSR